MCSKKDGDIVSALKAQGKFSTPAGARTVEQYQEMKKAEEEGVCIFCNPSGWKERPFHQGQYWLVKPNDYPYKHHFIHWVIVWKIGHLEDIQEVPNEAWAELGMMLSYLERRYCLPAINFVIRFGATELRSSTIHHLHGHIQIPDDDVLPRTPPATINIENISPIESFPGCIALDDPEGAPNQVYKLLVISTAKDNIGEIFPSLMISTLEMLKKFELQGGGIVIRTGDRRYTNGRIDVPYVTIYAPDGTGRVHATFIPSPTKKGKPLCKATFCKGFEGEELEKLTKRMREFTS